MQKIKLGIIFGGKSGEHKVSLSSVQGVISALNKDKYNLSFLAITKNGEWLSGKEAEEYLALSQKFDLESEEIKSFIENRKTNGLRDLLEKKIDGQKIDLILPILHGPFGEDGRLQGMLDILEIPYVFSNHLAHALAMNKPKTKIIAENVGVLTAKSLAFNRKEMIDLQEIVTSLKFPLIIKPAELGSSVGMTLTNDENELKAGIEKAFSVDENILLEEFISGREMTVTIIEVNSPKAIIITEIVSQKATWFDYNSKYNKGGSRHICPAEISKELEEKIKRQSEAIFKKVGCRDLARADFIVDKNEQIYFLEINTIPGMTPTSLVPEALQKTGSSLGEFLDEVIDKRLKK